MSSRSNSLNMVLGLWGAVGTVATIAMLIFQNDGSITLDLLAFTGWLCAGGFFWALCRQEERFDLLSGELAEHKQRARDLAGQIAQLQEDNSTLLKAHLQIAQMIPVETAKPRDVTE